MSLAGVLRPVFPSSALTSSADTANPIATTICRRTGRYSRIIRGPREECWLLYRDQARTRNVSVLRSDRFSQRRRKALVFFAILFHRTACDQVLQFFVSPQAEHFLASAGSVSRAEILVHNIKQF